MKRRTKIVIVVITFIIAAILHRHYQSIEDDYEPVSRWGTQT